MLAAARMRLQRAIAAFHGRHPECHWQARAWCSFATCHSARSISAACLRRSSSCFLLAAPAPHTSVLPVPKGAGNSWSMSQHNSLHVWVTYLFCGSSIAQAWLDK